MNSGIKIIKRSRTDGMENSPLLEDEKTVRQIEREITGTVKNWIAELAQRRRADEQNTRMRFFATIH